MMRIKSILLYAVIRLLRGSSKVNYEGAGNFSDFREEKLILAFWHRDLVLMMAFWDLAPIHAISTLSDRGMIIQSLLRRLGHAATLIPEGNAYTYVRRISKLLEKTTAPVAIVADGPLGPALQLKPTLLKLAAKHRRLILPLRIEANRYRAIEKRWDKLRIPRFPPRIRITVKTPLNCFEKCRGRSFEDFQVELAEALGLD